MNLPKGVRLIGKTWEERKLLWLEDISGEYNFLRSSFATAKGLNAAISIPILNKD